MVPFPGKEKTRLQNLGLEQRRASGGSLACKQAETRCEMGQESSERRASSLPAPVAPVLPKRPFMLTRKSDYAEASPQRSCSPWHVEAQHFSSKDSEVHLLPFEVRKQG